jgi:arylsulfatase A-like enzyme
MYKLFTATILSLLWCTGLLSQPGKKPPNIVIILADDLGWMDLSSYGSTFYETPHLDELASKGIRFTNYYAASPVCSPSRASLLTGKYPTKTGVTDWIKGRQENGKARPYEKLIAPPTAYQLALEENTIAEYALANGYQTFFAGKWHLGEEEKYWPQHQGLLTNIGGWSKGSPTGRKNDSTGGFFTPYQNPTIPDGPEGEYLTDRLTNECLQFIEQKKKEPFLLFHSLYAVHNPLQAPKQLIKKYQAKKEKLNISSNKRFVKDEKWMQYEEEWKRRIVQDNPVYAAMIENMDWNIGRMIAKLKELGLLDNTIIVFTSDNGGLSTAEGSPTCNLPLREGKGWLYEGGIRVPLIFYWNNKVKAGTVSDLPVNTIDIFPTIAKAINSRYRNNLTTDGTDIFQMLSQQHKYQNRTLIWHYPHYSNQGGKPGAAIREGNYKLIYHFEDKSTELFDVVKDIGEQINIARQYPKTAETMKKKLLKWIKENYGLDFTLNPAYNPSSQTKTVLPTE